MTLSRGWRLALMTLALAAIVGVIVFLWPEERGKDTIYNEETVAIMRRVLDSTSNCVDVGAYKGTLTKPMSEIAPRGTHYAFEPQPAFAKKLIDRFPNVRVMQLALGDHEDTATFILALDSPARSGFKRHDYPTNHERLDSITVRVARLDDIVPPSTRIAFIKIDVEGAEYLVLKGAKETIRRGRPVLAFEYGHAGIEYYGTTPETMWALLHDELGLELSLMRTFLDGGPAYTADEFVRMAKGGSEWMFAAYPASAMQRRR